MPLVPAILTTELQRFADPKSGVFTATPSTDAAACAAWAHAVGVYAAALVPPATTLPAALTALQAGLAGMSAPGGVLTVFPAAFAAFSAALVPGMLPGFISVPPPIPVIAAPPTFATVFAAGIAGAPASVQCGAIAGCIDAWMRLGTAQANTPPTLPPPVPWA